MSISVRAKRSMILAGTASAVVLCVTASACERVRALVDPTGLDAFRAACAATIGLSIPEAVEKLRAHGGEKDSRLYASVEYPDASGPSTPRCGLWLDLELRVIRGELTHANTADPVDPAMFERFARACEGAPGSSLEQAVGPLQDHGGGRAALSPRIQVTHGPTVDEGTPGQDDWSSRYCELKMDDTRKVVSAEMGSASFF